MKIVTRKDLKETGSFFEKETEVWKDRRGRGCNADLKRSRKVRSQEDLEDLYLLSAND